MDLFVSRPAPASKPWMAASSFCLVTRGYLVCCFASKRLRFHCGPSFRSHIGFIMRTFLIVPNARSGTSVPRIAKVFAKHEDPYGWWSNWHRSQVPITHIDLTTEDGAHSLTQMFRVPH